VEVLRLSREDFVTITRESPEIKNYLETRGRWKTLHSFLYEYSNFGRLPAPALNLLLEKLEPVSFPKGATIIRQGDPSGPMYIIKKGHVRVYITEGGVDRNRSFLREGDFFGELSLLKGTERTATAVAVADCELLALTKESVLELNARHSEFAKLMQERAAQYDAKTEVRLPLDFSAELLPAEAAAQTKRAAEIGTDKPADTDTSWLNPKDDLFGDGTGLFRKRSGRIGPVPFVRQIDEADCGAACLAMICRHFGRKVSLTRIRQLCHTSYDGTSLKAISNAASELGLASRALKVSVRNLPRMPLPAVVHWEGNHWIILCDVRSGFVRVMDPAQGARRIPREEFERKWSGYAEGRSSLGWLVPFFAKVRGPLFQIFLLSLVVSVLALLLPVITQVVVDKVILEQSPGLLATVVIGLAVTQVFLLLSNLVQQYLLSFVTVRVDAEVLDFLTRRLLSLPMSYFTSRRTGDIQRRLDGARQVRIFVMQQGLGGLLAVVQLAGSMCLMGAYDLTLLGCFVAVMPLYAALMWFSVAVVRPIYSDLEESYGRYNSQQIDAIKGIEAVKTSAAEFAFRDLMLNEFLTMARKRFKGQFASMAYQTGIQGVGLLSTTMFLTLGARMVINGGLTLGGFVAFSTLMGIAGGALLRTLNLWDDFQLVAVLLDRLNDVFDQEPEQGRDRSALLPIKTLEGHLELSNVGFRYGGPEAPNILQGVSLEIAPGRTVAIVGRSGCGKTTLIKLLAGLLEPTEGVIRLDHVDLKTLNYRDVRRKFGMVLQENHIFSDTILRNIAFGDPEPSFERVHWAAQMASAHDFIMRLPMGYETRIGESGLALSGGQKQRISIARAIYHDPPILIFDEATSALDTESERLIQNNLSRLMAGRTSIIIAHRLSTVRDANMIVVLEKGQVIETGTHEELMAARGLYFYLSSQQLGI
jgi:HlyB family type I secretion system ABC transporter